MTARDINNSNTRFKAFRDNPRLHIIGPTPVSAARLDNFVAPNKSIICHPNLQIVLETFSHAQPASKYSLSNGAETALTPVLVISGQLTRSGRRSRPRQLQQDPDQAERPAPAGERADDLARMSALPGASQVTAEQRAYRGKVEADIEAAEPIEGERAA